MPKNKNKNKKFSLDVSFHRAPLQDSGFVVDLRSKIQEQLPVKKTVEKATLPAARFWKAGTQRCEHKGKGNSAQRGNPPPP